MPELVVDLTWQQWEVLESIAQTQEISREEVVRRALDGYLAQQSIRRRQPDDDTLADTRDHLVGPNEVMDLDL
jgi:hypothetical protein